jgi:hypothetical protein
VVFSGSRNNKDGNSYHLQHGNVTSCHSTSSTTIPSKIQVNADEQYSTLHRLLVDESLVSSTNEATAVIESMLQEQRFLRVDSDKFHCIDIASGLRDYFDLPLEVVLHLMQEYFHLPIHNSKSSPNNSDISVECNENCLDQQGYGDDSDSGLDDDTDEVIGPGECELCERDCIKLTRHHLIPKSTWKRFEPMILTLWNKSAASSSMVSTPSSTLESFTEAKKCMTDESDGLDHLIYHIRMLALSTPSCRTTRGRQSAAGKRIIRDVLSRQTIDICRPCHDHIHVTYDNRTLALQYNTLDKLSNDATIAKHAQWASRQQSSNLCTGGAILMGRNRHRFKKLAKR